MNKVLLSLLGALSAASFSFVPLAGAETVSDSALPPQFMQYADELSAEEDVAQVTSVSEFSDVKPTDWAFTALQSLVERYGCIAGYPPAATAPGRLKQTPGPTFRGQRAMTRYEFAAGLNACMDKIDEIIAAGLADKVSKEDFAAVQRLQEEFAAELSALRGRVDALEAKTARLEAQQFSTTTKLTAQAIFALSGSSGDGRVLAPNGVEVAPSGSTNITFNSRIRLDFNTSFTGNDLLITRLEAGNGGASAGILGVAPPGDVGNVGFDTFPMDYAGVPNSFGLAKLRYDFNVGDDIRVSLGPVMHVYDHVDVNSFANNEAVDFSSTFFINNPLTVLINPLSGGAGAFVNWNPGGGAFSLRALYIAANGSDPNAGTNKSGSAIVTNRGLFGDPYQGTIEAEFAPKNADGEKPFAIRLQYTSGSVSNLDYDTGGVNVEWAFAKGAAIFGRYGFGTIDTRGLTVNLNPQTYQVGFAFPDLFKEGALAAIAVGSPFIESQVGNATQTNLELFYNFPLSENITITPDLQFIFNPNNRSENGTITVGTIRTVFTF